MFYDMLANRQPEGWWWQTAEVEVVPEAEAPRVGHPPRDRKKVSAARKQARRNRK